MFTSRAKRAAPRRHSPPPFATPIREAFAKAQAEVKDAGGETAEVKFERKASYPSFNLADDAPAVKHAKRAAESLGLKPTTMFSNGGLDANWLDKHGIPTVTIGAGQYEIHTDQGVRRPAGVRRRLPPGGGAGDIGRVTG